MGLVVFGFTYLVTAGIYGAVMVSAVGERARSFKAISPGLLPPLGIIFGLFVVFTAAQVWTDNEKARAEIDREASALRSVAIRATSFPRESQVQLRELIRRYIADVAAQEWPMMAQGTANLRAIPGVLAEALQATLALNPSSEGQKIAQRDIATALETALDARRQRIIISESQVNLLKWRRLKRGVFRSLKELTDAIHSFIADTNANPKPFIWTKDPGKIIAAVKRGHQVLDSVH